MSKKLSVAVLGASGRMGSLAVRAVQDAPDMDLAAALGRGDNLGQLVSAGAEYVVDLSVPESTEANVRFAVDHGLHTVVGTSGWDTSKLRDLQDLLVLHPETGVLIAPNFALGSVLASAFAATAARYFESVEIVEMHHPHKVDAPSGTADRTARLIAQSRREAGIGPSPDATASGTVSARGADVDGVRVHSVRLRGLIAHQEVLLGGAGEALSIRHDSYDRQSFMPGVLLGLRRVASRPGLTLGLDGYLDLGA